MPVSAHRLNASELRELLRSATRQLELRVPAIDRLNVFPVPDADTGTNMVCGMREGLREADRSPALEAAGVAEAFARGALAGARGNSGLILSQFWRGLAEAARGARTFGVEELKRGLASGCTLACRAVTRPVAGTILTVMQDVARAAEKLDGELPAFLRRLVEEARESVARTPRLLAVLRRAGVVDAGAEGLHRILEGAWRYLQRRAGLPAPEEELEAPGPPLEAGAGPAAEAPEGTDAYGFCVEFFLHDPDLDSGRVASVLQELGDSLIVTSAAEAVRVHIHAADPRAVLERAAGLGRLEQVSLRDMDAQHRESRRGVADRAGVVDQAGGQAVLAWVPGPGLAEVFRSLGAEAAAVRGAPSEEARLEECLQSAAASELILIPNLPDPDAEAERLRPRAPKRLHVLPARTVPQGVAAMVAFDPQAGLAENLRRMQEAIGQVRSLEVREEGAGVIGLLEGRLVAQGGKRAQVLERVLERALPGAAGARRLIIFFGAGVSREEGRDLGEAVRRVHPDLQVESVSGGQPGRGLIISLE